MWVRSAEASVARLFARLPGRDSQLSAQASTVMAVI
jgi:hypothetical protein